MGELTNAMVIPAVMVMVGIAFGYFLLNVQVRRRIDIVKKALAIDRISSRTTKIVINS
jgi:hypothetical protein